MSKRVYYDLTNEDEKEERLINKRIKVDDGGQDEVIGQIDTSKCLSRDVINRYMHILNQKFGVTNSIKCMDTFFAATLCERTESDIKKKADTFFNQLLTDGQLPKRIIIPVHLYDPGHWTVMCIFTTTHHISFIDSMSSVQNIFKGTYPLSYETGLKLFNNLLTVFDESKVASKPHLRGIFKELIPWLFFPGFHATPQKDRVSCGYYILACARLFAEISDIAKVIAFNIENIKKIKDEIAAEVESNNVGVPLDIQIVEFGPMKKSYDLRIKYRNIPNDMIKLKFLINPTKVSFKTTPLYSLEDGYCKESVDEFIQTISATSEGDNLTIVIRTLGKEQNEYRHLMRMLFVGFETIVGARSEYKSKGLNKIEIRIVNNYLYNTIKTNTSIIAFHDDYENNSMQFADDGESNKKKVVMIYDVLACYFHSLVLAATDLAIFVIREDSECLDSDLFEHSHEIMV